MTTLWIITGVNLLILALSTISQVQKRKKEIKNVRIINDQLSLLNAEIQINQQKNIELEAHLETLKIASKQTFNDLELQRLTKTVSEIFQSQQKNNQSLTEHIKMLEQKVRDLNNRYDEDQLKADENRAIDLVQLQINKVSQETMTLSKELEKTSWHLLEQLTSNNNRIDKIEEQWISSKINVDEKPVENGNMAHLKIQLEKFKKNYLSTQNTSHLTTQKKGEQENNDADEITNPVYKELDYQITSAFSQLTAIKNFPLVTMPVRDSKVLLPTIGKKQSRGIGESRFQPYLLEYFGTKIKSNFSLHFQGAKRKYEPDFVLMIPDRGLFIDIEVDEPYNGMSRKPTHYIGSYDAERNSYFNKNGWVVIRFAEEQVVKEPLECCKFVESVVKTLLEEKTENTPTNPTLIQQWTYDESLEMETNLYRESYLGITFDIATTGQDDEIEAYISPKSIFSNGLVKVDSFRKAPDEPGIAALRQVLENLINEKTCCRFYYIDREFLVDPVKLHQSRLEWILTALDLVTLQELEFELSQIYSFSSEPKPFLFEEDQKKLSTKDLIEIAADFSYYTLISYQKSSDEQSNRTLSHLERAYSPKEDEWWYNSNDYVVAYCNLRNESRTFRFDRIGGIKIINLKWNQTENNTAM